MRGILSRRATRSAEEAAKQGSALNRALCLCVLRSHVFSGEIEERFAQTLELLPASLHYQPDPTSPVNIRLILGTDYDPCADR